MRRLFAWLFKKIPAPLLLIIVFVIAGNAQKLAIILTTCRSQEPFRPV
jgi:hypothetical protein